MNAKELNEPGHQAIGGALEVHRELGPGLPESVYEQCLAHELAAPGISVERQVMNPILFASLRLCVEGIQQ